MIKEFQKEYRWLSNFWPCSITYEGEIYPSVEHAYQAAKFKDPVARKAIRDTETPGRAKRLAKRLSFQIREDWNDVNIVIMEELVRQKFTIHSSLRDLLLKTNDEYIQEGNWWQDEFWGINLQSGKGLNHLGKIIMKIRNEIHGKEL